MLKHPLVQGSIIRAGYGVLSLHHPRLLLKGLGMTEDDIGDQGRYFNRLFGGREVLIAMSSIAALKSGNEAKAVRANIICAATDAVALAHEAKDRGGVDKTLIRAIGFNVLSWVFVARSLGAAKAAKAAGAVTEAAPEA